jgi:hypothetical protein
MSAISIYFTLWQITPLLFVIFYGECGFSGSGRKGTRLVNRTVTLKLAP